MTYTPDKWLIVKYHIWSDITYKVFATWNKEYTEGDEWRMNSGIVKVEVDGEYYLFYGHSGSVYRCHKKGYGTNGCGMIVLDGFDVRITHERIEHKVPANMEILDDKADWKDFFENVYNCK